MHRATFSDFKSKWSINWFNKRNKQVLGAANVFKVKAWFEACIFRGIGKKSFLPVPSQGGWWDGAEDLFFKANFRPLILNVFGTKYQIFSGLAFETVFFRIRSSELEAVKMSFFVEPYVQHRIWPNSIKLQRIWSNVGRGWPFWVIWTFLQTRIMGPVPRTAMRSQGRDCCTVCFRSTNFCLENNGRLFRKILSCSANEKKLSADTSWHIW